MGFNLRLLIFELQQAKDELEVFYILSRCGRLARQLCDYLLEYADRQHKENDTELFFANPDSDYINDGYAHQLRKSYKTTINVYLNMLSATIIKQRLLIAKLRGEKLDPIRSKDHFLPMIERKFPYLFTAE